PSRRSGVSCRGVSHSREMSNTPLLSSSARRRRECRSGASWWQVIVVLLCVTACTHRRVGLLSCASPEKASPAATSGGKDAAALPWLLFYEHDSGGTSAILNLTNNSRKFPKFDHFVGYFT